MLSLKNFHVALTFLTRLGRAEITSSEAISKSMPMYPLVGGLIGLILALLAQLPLSSWVLAWILTGTNIWLTRGLHWDGWADLWDGWGSGATGERFWDIVKDSRVGAFGVIGLVLGLGLQTALFESALHHLPWVVLPWSGMLGRLCCLALAFCGRGLGRPGLGQNALRGATGHAVLFGAICTLIPALFLPPLHVALALLLTLPALGALLRLGQTQGAINGDFLGAAIIVGEMCALLPMAFHGL